MGESVALSIRSFLFRVAARLTDGPTDRQRRAKAERRRTKTTPKKTLFFGLGLVNGFPSRK